MYILGDPKYPLLRYLINELSSGGITPEIDFLPYRHSSARMDVMAFGHLKGPFGVFRKNIDIELKTTLNFIYICSILHNFCEMNIKNY